MRKYLDSIQKHLDEKFAVAAKGAGHPYFILLNLVGFIALGFLAHSWWVWLAVWLDIIISIWTLILDLIIVNQNNRQNDHNATQLQALREAIRTISEMADRQLTLENQILKMEKEHGEKLDILIARGNGNKA